MPGINVSQSQLMEVQRWVLEDKGGRTENQRHLGGWADFSWNLSVYSIDGRPFIIVEDLHPVAQEPGQRRHIILCNEEHQIELSQHLGNTQFVREIQLGAQTP